jgi:hypothetical protein
VSGKAPRGGCWQPAGTTSLPPIPIELLRAIEANHCEHSWPTVTHRGDRQLGGAAVTSSRVPVAITPPVMTACRRLALPSGLTSLASEESPVDPRLSRLLADQLSRGEVILFTGAGFSLAARARDGEQTPSAGQLRDILWPVAFPGEGTPDADSTLGDIYQCAIQQARNRTRDVLTQCLQVDHESIPKVYQTWFSTPWYRIYTLNIDDLDEAVQRKYALPVRIRSLSALSDELPARTSDLLSIHLNGKIADFPNLTFSAQQYGDRTALPDPWYRHLVAELSTHPVIFVGTTLDEPPLWQHIALRQARARGARELRPHSYLVTPSLSRAQQSVLGQYNVEWIASGQEEFAEGVLGRLVSEATQGHAALQELRSSARRREVLHPVGELRAEQVPQLADYLMGREVTWPDITEGYA